MIVSEPIPYSEKKPLGTIHADKLFLQKLVLLCTFVAHILFPLYFVTVVK